jgi:SAM-dependent methyltransferase
MTGDQAQTRTPTEHDHVHWFWEHYDGAAQQVIDFLAADGFDLEGKQVADIGCGDGIIDLGVAHKARPAKLIGYDVRTPDAEALARTVEAVGLEQPIPDAASFALTASTVDHLPAPDSTFDFAYSWSVFEHVAKPAEMFTEIRRVLKPDGVLFLQIWPLYHSEHGGHLWLSYPDEFPHLRKPDSEIERKLKFEPATDPTRPADDEYRSLNRLTIDDLQRALMAGGLMPTKLELMAETVHIPKELSRYPLSSLGISGVKLLAVPRFKDD